MNLASLKQRAGRRTTAGLVGLTLQAEEVEEMVKRIEELSQAPVLARKARMALLDHDLTLARSLLGQIEALELEAQ